MGGILWHILMCISLSIGVYYNLVLQMIIIRSAVQFQDGQSLTTLTVILILNANH